MGKEHITPTNDSPNLTSTPYPDTTGSPQPTTEPTSTISADSASSTSVSSGSTDTTADTSGFYSATSSTNTAITMSDTTSTPTPNSTDPSTSVAVAASSSTATNSSLTTTSTNAGAIAGGVVGGVVVLALLILGLILFRRARRRRHIAPSSEFAETIKRGEMPVLRLDSGMEIVPSAPTHHVPLPLRRDSYHTSPVMSDIKLPDTTMGSDTQSVRFSLEKPLQPLRYPVQQDSNDSMSHAAPRVSSIGSSQELWSRDSGRFDTRKDLRSQSPLSVTADTGYSSLTQNTYPMEHSRTAETVPNAYTDLWKLSVAPISRRRPASAADAQALPPLIPVRRSVDVGRR